MRLHARMKGLLVESATNYINTPHYIPHSTHYFCFGIDEGWVAKKVQLMMEKLD